MFKRFTHGFACLLLVLMPLQSIATANMSICNSLVQVQNHAHQHLQQTQLKPCHMHIAGMTNVRHDSCKHNSACKATCATLCANLSAMAAIPSDIKPVTLLASTQAIGFPEKNYVSITQANLQRPPISFI